MSTDQVVLVVEPDVTFALEVTTTLERQGIRVERVARGDAVLEALAMSAPDLVILDLILSRMDGRTVLRELREHPATANVPIVVLGRAVGKSLREEAFALGADAYFDRPVGADELCAAVMQRLERQSAMRTPSRKDIITGVLNRAAAVEDAWALIAGDGLDGILLIDTDGISRVRDAAGWASAEYVLVEVARRLRSVVPPEIRVARWEGDTFVLLIPRSGRYAAESISEACIHAVADGRFDAPDGHSYSVSISCGWAQADADAYLASLMNVARRRVFRAQEQGGNRFDLGESSVDDAPVRQYTVLVAEDDPVAATLVEHHLLSEGFSVRRYGDGASALAGAIEHRPDLVLLDVKMPIMDGFEALERLRATPAVARLPIMMLTGLGNDSDLVRAFDLGADDYMVKPFSPPELAARIRRLLRR